MREFGRDVQHGGQATANDAILLVADKLVLHNNTPVVNGSGGTSCCTS
jgi:hypothetical protein